MKNNELLEALNVLEAEKNISKDVLFGSDREFASGCLQKSFWKE